MKYAKIIVLTIFVLFLLTPLGLFAQSSKDDRIELAIFDPEKSKFDLMNADYLTLSEKLEMIDITKFVFKKFVYENEIGKEEMLLIIKQSNQPNIYEITSGNIDKILVVCYNKKLYSFALIRESIASPLVIQKL